MMGEPAGNFLGILGEELYADVWVSCVEFCEHLGEDVLGYGGAGTNF